MDNVDINFRMMASGNAVPELRKAQQGVKNLGDQIDRSQSRMRGFNNGITTMQANTRKFAMGGLQQAGFQLGDYAVQVANGTSKMQAFGQQAPQFLQIFGPIGAIVGAGVAIVAAFGVAAQRSGASFLDFTTALQTGQSALAAAKKGTKAYREELALLASGLKTVEMLEVKRAATALRAEISQKKLRLEEESSQRGRNNTSRSLKAEIALRETLLAELDQQLRFTKAFNQATENLADPLKKFKDVVFDPRAANYDPVIAEFARVALAMDDVTSTGEEVEKSTTKIFDSLKRVNKEGREFEDWVFDVRDPRFDPVIAEFARLQLGIKNTNEAGVELKRTIDKIANIRSQIQRDNEIVFDPRDPRYDEMRVKMAAIAAETGEVTKSSDKANSGVKELANTINRELSPAMKQLQTVQESVSSSFENGFMSIIDGTSSVKDAFKSMASEIIKELYRIFVVKRITGMIGGFFNMNQVSGPSMPLGTGNIRPVMRPPSANGGGYTGNGARAGGLDGKGGFMAMIHPRETVVDHTKGQGMGGVTVIQNNTFQSGVTRSEVSALLPKMVEASKAAVLDAKRQGGSYGKAFA